MFRYGYRDDARNLTFPEAVDARLGVMVISHLVSGVRVCNNHHPPRCITSERESGCLRGRRIRRNADEDVVPIFELVVRPYDGLRLLALNRREATGSGLFELINRRPLVKPQITWNNGSLN